MDIIVEQIENIPGLFYIENVIDNENQLIKIIDKNRWIPISSHSNSRVVQHYGYTYDYFKKKIEKTIDIPDFLLELRIQLSEICKQLEIINDNYIFNQCIINNYNNNQCISKHIDLNTFGSVIGCFSLGSKCDMRFQKGSEKYDIEIKPKSLYIMSGESRYKWTHEMIKNKNSERRISITFRNVS